MLHLLARTVRVQETLLAPIHVPEVARIAVARFIRDAAWRAHVVVWAEDWGP